MDEDNIGRDGDGGIRLGQRRQSQGAFGGIMLCLVFAIGGSPGQGAGEE